MQWRKFIAVLVIALAAVLITAMVINQFTGKPPMQSISLMYLTGPEAVDLLTSKASRDLAISIPPVVEGWDAHRVFISGTARVRKEAAELLAKEDVPKPPVVLKFQIIEANGFTQSDTSIARIESVLRGLFRFRGYRLVAEAYLRTKEESTASQLIIGADDVQYGINVNVHKVMRREGKASAEVTTELWAQAPSLIALSNTANMPDGQTIVLGTARPRGARGALILVVTPEIR